MTQSTAISENVSALRFRKPEEPAGAVILPFRRPAAVRAETAVAKPKSAPAYIPTAGARVAELLDPLSIWVDEVDDIGPEPTSTQVHHLLAKCPDRNHPVARWLEGLRR